MIEKENRRNFIQKIGWLSLAAGTGSMLPVPSAGSSSRLLPADEKSLVSLSSSDLFSVLDLQLPELAPVRKALEKKGHDAALAELLKYYRTRYLKPQGTAKQPLTESEKESVSKADDLEKHIFQWGPYPPAGYGNNINWAADPAGDIEWVAAVYRFYWVNDLLKAYILTGDERFARIYTGLIADWISKHPLEETVNIVHPVYGWKGYPWLDLQTGIRATNICHSFRTFVHSPSVTPRFLGILLTSLYDHQVKTEKMPMNSVHNKAIFEQRGFFNVIHTFPEFKDKERWLKTAIELTCENLLAQTTTDGVQREWCGGYHSAVYRDALEIESRVRDLGYSMPDYYNHRVRAMAEHIFGISTPDLGFPMFGDTARPKSRTADRRSWPLYNLLAEATEKFGDPKFQALANLDTGNLPSNGSIAFQNAGLYAMRSGWSPEQVYMALHCSPPAISTHDTPDNGTFELYAYGRWLMPDSGFYTYGHDKEARTWHRQTKIHATMTLDGNDIDFIGRQLLWKTGEDSDVLCIENQSYKYFLHRRTVWFEGKKSSLPFFVIFDEAITDAKGEISIHFPMAPGPVKIDNEGLRIVTDSGNANLLVQVFARRPVILREEEGWHAWEYGSRESRTSVSACYEGRAPLVFVSVLVPFKGTNPPLCRLVTDPASLIAGMDPAELEVELAGERHLLSRKI